MELAIKISRQSVTIDNGIEVRRANSTGRKVPETINFDRLVFVGFFVNQAHRWCHQVLGVQLQSVLYPRHNQGMQSPRKLLPSDSSNPNNRLRMSIESLEMGRSILPHSFHSTFNCSNSSPLVGCCYLLLDERSAERSERNGQFLVEPPFEIAWSFSEGVVTVDKNSKFGCLNTANPLVIPHQFPFFRHFF